MIRMPHSTTARERRESAILVSGVDRVIMETFFDGVGGQLRKVTRWRRRCCLKPRCRYLVRFLHALCVPKLRP